MSTNDDLPPLPAARFPQMYYCNKCGNFPLSSEHEGCNYMAVTDGTGHKFSAEQMQAYAREAVEADGAKRVVTTDMLRAGQEALFEACPEYTIEEREELAREVWVAMRAVAPPKDQT